jgi:hypothetical protein
MRMNSVKFTNAVVNCLVEVYYNAIPKADFIKLMDDAEIEPDGRKKIPFDDYVIDDSVFKDIVEKHIKQSKIPKYLRESFRFSLYLGPSPRSVKNENI